MSACLELDRDSPSPLPARVSCMLSDGWLLAQPNVGMVPWSEVTLPCLLLAGLPASPQQLSQLSGLSPCIHPLASAGERDANRLLKA